MLKYRNKFFSLLLSGWGEVKWIDFNGSLQIFSPQERRGVASWPSTAQQGGDDECGCKAFPTSPWWGGEGFLSNDTGEGGEGRKRRGGETQPDHRSQSWHFPLCTGRSKIMIDLTSLVTVICDLWFLCVCSRVILQHWISREFLFYFTQHLVL